MRWSGRLMFVGVALGLGTGVAGSVRAADAERIGELLRVRPGATCLSADALVPHIEPWLHRTQIANDVTIEVQGSATDPRSARVRVLRGGRVVAHRAFFPGPARCSYLRAAIGLSIGLAIEASLLQGLGDPLPDDPVARESAWSVSVAGLSSYRLLPKPAFGVGATAWRALGPHVAFQMGALGVTASNIELGRGAGAFRAALGALQTEACARANLDQDVHAGACVGFLGGLLDVAGSDVANAERSAVGWFALSNAADVEFDLSERWSVALGLTLTSLLHRIRVGIEDSNGAPAIARTLAPTGFVVGLGPVYRF